MGQQERVLGAAQKGKCGEKEQSGRSKKLDRAEKSRIIDTFHE